MATNQTVKGLRKLDTWKMARKGVIRILIIALLMIIVSNFITWTIVHLHEEQIIIAKTLEYSNSLEKLLEENKTLSEEFEYYKTVLSSQRDDYKELYENQISKTTMALSSRGNIVREVKITKSDADVSADEFTKSENTRLRQTIATMASSRGSQKVNDVETPNVSSLDDYELIEDLGDWKLTYYSPSKEQCGNIKAIGSSGKTVLPGYSCAIDSVYWEFGTMFYVEGFGIVEAMDTGSGIKGKQRMDLCVYNSDVCNELGVTKGKVWLLKKK